MNESFTIDWVGETGNSYKYWSGSLSGSYKHEAGNYMFVKPTGNNRYVPVYIGQADDLGTRLANHERLSDAKRAGATLIMAHTSQGTEASRLAEEKDLIRKWSPALNTQHRKIL